MWIRARPALIGHMLASEVAHRLLRLRRIGRAPWRPATLRAITRVRPWRGPALPLAWRPPEPGYDEGTQMPVWRPAPFSPWSDIISSLESVQVARSPTPPVGSGLTQTPQERASTLRPSELYTPEPLPHRSGRHATTDLQATPGQPDKRSQPAEPRTAQALHPTPLEPGPARSGLDQAHPALSATQDSVQGSAIHPQPDGKTSAAWRSLIAAVKRLPSVLRTPTDRQQPVPSGETGQHSAPASQLPPAPTRPAPRAQTQPVAAEPPAKRPLPGEAPASPGQAARVIAQGTTEAPRRSEAAQERVHAGGARRPWGQRPLSRPAPLRVSAPTTVRPGRLLQRVLERAHPWPATAMGSPAPRQGPGAKPIQQAPPEQRPPTRVPSPASGPESEAESEAAGPAQGPASVVQARHEGPQVELTWPAPSVHPLPAFGPEPEARAAATARPIRSTASAGPAQRELPLARPFVGRSERPTPTDHRSPQPPPIERVTNLAPLHTEEVVQRVASEPIAPEPERPARAGEAAPRAGGEGTPTPPALDLEAIAGQVHEILRRRLRIERERSYGRGA